MCFEWVNASLFFCCHENKDVFYTRQLFKDKVYKLTFCLISFYCSEFPSSQIWYAASQFTYAVTKSWECQLKWILGGISFSNSKVDLWLMFHMAKNYFHDWKLIIQKGSQSVDTMFNLSFYFRDKRKFFSYKSSVEGNCFLWGSYIWKF